MIAADASPPLSKVLLVDDQPINIQTLYEILGDSYDVFMATSGQQALDACEDTLPDLILLDVMMPDMDGLEVCRRLKQNPCTADIPVIFVTAQNHPEEEAMGLDVGAVDFISKPLNAPVVRARVRTHLALKRQGDLLRMQALIDGLTGISNRRRFDENLAVQWQDCKRHGEWLSLILIDIDHFKKYNDHYGHPQGDTCLRTVGALINSLMRRAHDLAARYGGEEFVCVLPNCDLEGALRVAETIRTAVYGLAIAHQTSSTAANVSISLGVGSLVPSDGVDCSRLVALADQQLYAAKETGRNRVCGASLAAAAQ